MLPLVRTEYIFHNTNCDTETQNPRDLFISFLGKNDIFPVAATEWQHGGIVNSYLLCLVCSRYSELNLNSVQRSLPLRSLPGLTQVAFLLHLILSPTHFLSFKHFYLKLCC